jgi:hypothetical protein
MPFAIGHRLTAQALGEFVKQARLANAGLARDTDHLPLALAGVPQVLMQHRQLALTPDEPAQDAPATPQHSRPPLSDPVHLVH